MIRSSRLVTNISRRGFSTTRQPKFLNRLRLWPFERRPDPVSYRLQVVRPPQNGARFLRNTIRWAIIISVARYFLPFSVSFSTEENAKGVESEETEEEEEDDIDDDEAGLFIPLTWPVEVERTFYRGSDPEWQDYVKFAKDKESQKRAHQAVVMLCRQAFIDVPQLAKSIGKVDVTKGKYWLDVDFPMGPPPDYEQIGVEFGSSFVALAVQTLSQQDYIELCRIFDPRAVATAAYITVYASLKSILVYTGSLIQASKARAANGSAKPGHGEAAGHDATTATKLSFGSTSTSPNEARDATRTEYTPASPEEQVSEDTLPETNEKGNVSQKLIRDVFAAPFSQTHREYAPPRGSIVLGGLVECHGTNYVATIDVTACWDLTDEQIVMHNAKVRHISPRRIAPHPPARMPPFSSSKTPRSPSV